MTNKKVVPSVKNGGLIKETISNKEVAIKGSGDQPAMSWMTYCKLNQKKWARESNGKLVLEYKSGKLVRLAKNKEFYSKKHKAWKEESVKAHALVEARLKDIFMQNNQVNLDVTTNKKTGEIVSSCLRTKKRNLEAPTYARPTKKSLVKARKEAVASIPPMKPVDNLAILGEMMPSLNKEQKASMLMQLMTA